VIHRRVPHRLETERLKLVAVDQSHARDLNRAARESFDELRPWMGWVADLRLQQTENFAREMEHRWKLSEGWMFAIMYDGRAVGTIGLDVYQPMLEQAQLGYWIRSDLAGQGLMKEAARAVVNFAFEEVGLHRLELHASPDNVASVKVAEAVGFRREGLARDIARNVDGYYDCLTFGLLATDERP
jgi:ribosomal-protein-serine acetyltransferase